MPSRFQVTLLAATALLTGCGETPPDRASVEAPTAQGETKAGKGAGTVTSIDAAAGTITIDHEAMPEIGWSAMTMTFDADRALLAGVAVGDKVTFDLTVTDGRGEITAIAAD